MDCYGCVGQLPSCQSVWDLPSPVLTMFSSSQSAKLIQSVRKELWDRLLLFHRPGWAGTSRDLPASTSHVLRLNCVSPHQAGNPLLQQSRPWAELHLVWFLHSHLWTAFLMNEEDILCNHTICIKKKPEKKIISIHNHVILKCPSWLWRPTLPRARMAQSFYIKARQEPPGSQGSPENP